MNKINIVIVEDETLVAQMLGTWLERCGACNVVGCASTSGQGLTKEPGASPLNLPVFTVRKQLYTLHLKLGLRSHAELIRFASQPGLAS